MSFSVYLQPTPAPSFEMSLFRDLAQPIALNNEKTGMVGSRLMTASEFKKKMGVKGNQAKRDYIDYLAKNGSNAAARIKERVNKDEFVFSGVRVWKETGKFQMNGYLASALVLPADEPASAPKSFQKMSPVEKAAFINAMPETERNEFLSALGIKQVSK